MFAILMKYLLCLSIYFNTNVFMFCLIETIEGFNIKDNGRLSVGSK